MNPVLWKNVDESVVLIDLLESIRNAQGVEASAKTEPESDEKENGPTKEAEEVGVTNRGERVISKDPKTELARDRVKRRNGGDEEVDNRYRAIIRTALAQLRKDYHGPWHRDDRTSTRSGEAGGTPGTWTGPESRPCIVAASGSEPGARKRLKGAHADVLAPGHGLEERDRERGAAGSGVKRGTETATTACALDGDMGQRALAVAEDCRIGDGDSGTIGANLTFGSRRLDNGNGNGNGNGTICGTVNGTLNGIVNDTEYGTVNGNGNGNGNGNDEPHCTPNPTQVYRKRKTGGESGQMNRCATASEAKESLPLPVEEFLRSIAGSSGPRSDCFQVDWTVSFVVPPDCTSIVDPATLASSIPQPESTSTTSNTAVQVSSNDHKQESISRSPQDNHTENEIQSGSDSSDNGRATHGYAWDGTFSNPYDTAVVLALTPMPTAADPLIESTEENSRWNRPHNFRIPALSTVVLHDCRHSTFFRSTLRSLSSEPRHLSIYPPTMCHSVNSNITPPSSTSTTAANQTPATVTYPQHSRKFDIIVMDPPWPNASAKRKSKFNHTHYRPCSDMRSIRSLLASMDIDALVKSDDQGGTLVGVWITNKAAIRQYLLSPTGFFAAIGVSLVQEWVWAKLTSEGDLICPLDDCWRRPYEVFLLASTRPNAPPKRSRRSKGSGRPSQATAGRDTGPSETFSRTDPVSDPRFSREPRSCEEMMEREELGGEEAAADRWYGDTEGGREGGEEEEEEEEAEEEGTEAPVKVIFAVPDTHSRKPCLKGLLEDYWDGRRKRHEPSTPVRAMEVFARNLVKGWWSWGDEVLLHNYIY